MRTMKRKVAVAATGLVAAAGISLLGAGAATAATPADGLHRTQPVQQQSKVAPPKTLCTGPGGIWGPPVCDPPK